MIKQIFTLITGIDESIDDDDAQASWQRQKYLDEHDLDDAPEEPSKDQGEADND